jgi:hypothetical protein
MSRDTRAASLSDSSISLFAHVTHVVPSDLPVTPTLTEFRFVCQGERLEPPSWHLRVLSPTVAGWLDHRLFKVLRRRCRLSTFFDFPDFSQRSHGHVVHAIPDFFRLFSTFLDLFFFFFSNFSRLFPTFSRRYSQTLESGWTLVTDTSRLSSGFSGFRDYDQSSSPSSSLSPSSD